MKKVVLVILLCVATIVNSYSQTKQESIQELFRVMSLDSLMDKTIKSSLLMQTMVKDSSSKAHFFKERMSSLMPTLQEICKKMINEDMVTVYGKYFSQNEINELIAFYKTPVGQKFIKVTPVIQNEMRKILIGKYLPEIQKLVKTKIDN